MSFIELYENRRYCGKFDLPREVRGSDGGVFTLGRSKTGGGNGIVFEAQSPRYGLCAVKLLRQQDDTRFDRFQNELRIMRMLEHPRIARFLDSGQIDFPGGYRAPWVAMELGDGNLRQHVQQKGAIRNKTLVSAGAQMCEALEHLRSKGIVHRDIKPDNFVWRGEDLLMIDFGIAKLLGEDVSARPMDQFTRDQELVGPMFYFSPELIAYGSDKKVLVDHRSDLFQLGKVLWFVATGQVSAGIPSSRQCPFGGQLHRIVASLLHDDPNDRPNSAAIIRDRLLEIS